MQASLCAGGAGDDGPVALPPPAAPGAGHAPSHMMDQPEHQRGAHHTPSRTHTPLQEVADRLWCYSLTLAQIQAFLWGFGDLCYL